MRLKNHLNVAATNAAFEAGVGLNEANPFCTLKTGFVASVSL